jgi:hypothetical protein
MFETTNQIDLSVSSLELLVALDFMDFMAQKAGSLVYPGVHHWMFTHP